MSTVLCQGQTKDGSPCQRPATHQHVTQLGTRVSVCGTHLRMLKKRERNGSDEEKLASWGVTDPALTNPGATGHPIPPEGIAG